MNTERSTDDGFSLVELTIATVVLAALVAALYSVLGSGMDVYQQGTATADLERKGQRVLEQLSEELVLSGLDVLTPQTVPPYGSHTLTLQQNLGWSGSGVNWGPPTTFEFRPDPGDPEDGKDNNGNGLIDEGMVVRIEMTPSGPATPVVMTRWVSRYLEGETRNGKDDNGNGLIDEPGLCFDRVGDIWMVRLSLERLDGAGRRICRTLETAVRPRN